jgi:WD40 repeat protein
LQEVSPPLKHSLSVRHVAFSPDGKFLLTASWDKSARVWDISKSDWPVEEIENFAEVESSSTIGADGTLQPMSVDDVAGMLQTLQKTRGKVYQQPAEKSN